MLGRIRIYLREMYPLLPRLILGLVIFFEIYFIILLNAGITSFRIGVAEFVGAFTVFSFLLFLRIADDFKDYEGDKRLFPERALPSGRVYKSDLRLVLVVVLGLTVVLNVLFMNNLLFFAILFVYGILMSVWFFARTKIQPSLPLALITHNPVQMVMNIYIISFTLIKYDLDWRRLYVFLAAFTLYFPALIWEIGRKIRPPEAETDYTTYSKLFGVRRSVRFIAILTLVDITTNILLVWNLNQISALLLALAASWMTWRFIAYVRRPGSFALIRHIEGYTYVQESLMLLTIVVYLLIGRVGL